MIKKKGDIVMELQRTRIVDGTEVASSEYFNALRAINFIEEYNLEWYFKHDEIFDVEQAIEHAKIIAAERGFELIIDSCMNTGFKKIGLSR